VHSGTNKARHRRRYLSQFFLTLLIFWYSVLLIVLFGPEEYIQNGWRGVFQMFLNLTIRGYVVFTMLVLKIWEFFGTSATKYMAVSAAGSAPCFGNSMQPLAPRPSACVATTMVTWLPSVAAVTSQGAKGAV
jgi:hypothetical protein